MKLRFEIVFSQFKNKSVISTGENWEVVKLEGETIIGRRKIGGKAQYEEFGMKDIEPCGEAKLQAIPDKQYKLPTESGVPREGYRPCEN